MHGIIKAKPPALASLPGKLTRTYWRPPKKLSIEEWRSCVAMFQYVEGAAQWWIGDSLIYGEKQPWGKMYAKVVDEMGIDYQTARNCKWIAENFQLSRRRDKLSWGHHGEVAGLNPKVADRLLDKAERDNLSVAKLRKLVKEHKRKTQRAASRSLRGHIDIHNCDFKDAPIDAGSVDFIITDPPYPEEFIDLYAGLADAAARWLRPGGSLLAMAGQTYLPQVLAALGSSSLTYRWTVAYLTPGGQSVQIFPRRVNTFWKPVFWFTNGEPDNERWIGDVTRSNPNDNDKRFHDWGQSEGGFADLIERFTLAGDLICDPFMGGGTTGVAALALGRNFIGVDSDSKTFKVAKKRLGVR